MMAATRSAGGWDWRQIADLGQQLRRQGSLGAQRDHILSVTSRYIDGEVELWLEEKVFRLPDWETGRIFPPKPPLPGMKQAIRAGEARSRKFKVPGTDHTFGWGYFAALPIIDSGICLGAMQVTRPSGPAFSEEELNRLKGMVQFVAANLSSFHRAEVEQFRIAQLELVRAVSAQIANVLDLDELARRVTDLIQRTFNYYYVAIFTLEIESNALVFRSSASASRMGRKKPAIKLEVEVGQGLIGEAALTGQRILSDDVRSDTRFRFIDRLPETKSEIAIPLRVEDRILGVMDVQSNRRRAFHPIDIMVLNSLADSIARAVESARHYSGMVQRADQLAFLSEISKIVASSLDLPVILAQSAKLIEDRFGYAQIALFTVHPNRRLIQYEAGCGPANRIPRGYSISLDSDTGTIGRTARQGRTNLVNDLRQFESFAQSPQLSKDLRSELCVPLVFEEVVLGILDLQSNHLNAFIQDDQRMFEAAADTMAAAIRNADLFRSEQWRRQVSDSLREVAGLVSANVGLEEVLEAILTELDRNLTIEVSAAWLLAEGEISLAAVHGCEAEELEGLCLTEPESVVSMLEALRTGVPLIRPPKSPQWPVELVAGFDTDSSSIAAPLLVRDRPLGILTITHHSAGRYGHEALAITTTFASNAAVAIENARLYDATQEQAYASAALLQVAQAVASSSDLNEVLGTIIRILPILVGVRRAILYRWEESKEAFLATHQYGLDEDEQKVFTEREMTAGDFPALAYTHERNLMVAFAVQADRPVQAWLAIDPTLDVSMNPIDPDQILMSIPLSIKNDFYGILLVEEADRAGRFRPRRIEILNGIAQQTALAIQNDLLQQELVERERLETEIHLARQIQQTFIPQVLPSHASWQLAACWRTARQVGGDFYDVIELPDGRLGIFIADVADKGIPAALFMALTRTLVRAAILESSSPEDVLRRVNEQLLPDAQQGMFVTAVYGVLDLERGSFAFVNAGHNPPFWVKADSGIEKLTRTGIALGVVERAELKQRQIGMQPGDVLLLYTDGLTEAFSPDGEPFGETRLVEILSSVRSGTAQEMLDRIEESLNYFTDPNPRSDDLTMVAIKRI